MRRVQLRVCVGFVFVAWLSVVLLTAETEPAGLASSESSLKRSSCTGSRLARNGRIYGHRPSF